MYPYDFLRFIYSFKKFFFILKIKKAPFGSKIWPRDCLGETIVFFLNKGDKFFFFDKINDLKIFSLRS